MKINFDRYDFCFDDNNNYDDFEKVNCVREGKQGIHEEIFPSKDSWKQLKRQNMYDSQTINELLDINSKYEESLQNEIHERILLHNHIIIENFISYLFHPSTFGLKLALKNIKETIQYFEKAYSFCLFDEIPDHYLTCIKVLSFFENIIDKDEDFLKTRRYCYSFKDKYNQQLFIEKKNFNDSFDASLKYGKQIYKEYDAKNKSELEKLINNLLCN